MKDLVEIYSGNLAEALKIKASLNEKGINPIYKKIDHNYLNDIKGLENPTSQVSLE